MVNKKQEMRLKVDILNMLYIDDAKFERCRTREEYLEVSNEYYEGLYDHDVEQVWPAAVREEALGVSVAQAWEAAEQPTKGPRFAYGEFSGTDGVYDNETGMVALAIGSISADRLNSGVDLPSIWRWTDKY